MARSAQVPHAAIAAALRARLDEGEWRPGEQLPSARAIAREYGVSATTAARAVRTLADEGRVVIVANWGVFVAADR
jgi:GntR family transcriptional regulator